MGGVGDVAVAVEVGFQQAEVVVALEAVGFDDAVELAVVELLPGDFLGGTGEEMENIVFIIMVVPALRVEAAAELVGLTGLEVSFAQVRKFLKGTADAAAGMVELQQADQLG